VSGPIADTASGRVRGRTDGSVRVFKGIRYGGTASGGSRFMAPTQPAPWLGVCDASAYGPSCPQMSGGDRSYFARVLGDSARQTEASTQEDCLFLNVWAPDSTPDGQLRPVMVWLHGGAFTAGSGSQRVYDGRALVRRGNVVVVTLNHRLGVLGYLHLGEIGGSMYASSGNAGMLDIVAALRWVRDNIASFGGDPGNVTIFGVSGGGLKVSALLAMPQAEGLFHRAAIQSGPGLRFESPAPATARAHAIIRELGLTPEHVASLHDLPVDMLIGAQTALVERAGGRPATSGELGFSPHIDGCVIPTQPGDALAAGASSRVPLLIGCTREEYTRLLPSLEPMTFADLHARLAPRLGAEAHQIIAAYRDTAPEASALDLLIWILTDQMSRLPTIKLAERKLSGGTSPVYMYLLTWPSPALDGRAKAAHSLCTPLVFDNTHADPLTAPYPSSRALAARMSAAWAAFAHNGNPNHPGLPEWPSYSADGRATMIFDDQCEVQSDPMADRRAAWRHAATGGDVFV
jgi:para-nitrobenzyl esterase